MTPLRVIFHASVKRRLFGTLQRTSIESLAATGRLKIEEEVSHALHTGKGIVALESAIITHGFPRPDNFNTALELERIVRNVGAVPAHIAVMDGVLRVGLNSSDLERLAEKPDNVKLSQRDLAPALAWKRTGGTTCAATMYIAHKCSIDIFATGGLGGVHRRGETTFDISADLVQLAHTPIILVSAGIKSILDIGRTLEYLETQGVNVVTYGPTRAFPAFYSPRSGFQSPWNASSMSEVLELLAAQHDIATTKGTLLAVPIPNEYEKQGIALQTFVDQAITESQRNGMDAAGKDITPWLLDRIRELSGGKSLESNKALICRTVSVAAELSASRSRSPIASNHVTLPATGVSEIASNGGLPNPALVVIGAAGIDVTSIAYSTSEAQVNTLSTVRGKVTTTLGGVGRNVAEAAHRVLSGPHMDDKTTLLISPVGTDPLGGLVNRSLEAMRMRTDGLITIESQHNKTAVCSLYLNDSGDLISGVADMDIVEKCSETQFVEVLKNYTPKLVLMDGNLSSEVLSGITAFCSNQNIPVFFEPTSLTKCKSIFFAIKNWINSQNGGPPPVSFISPNVLELKKLLDAAVGLELVGSARWKDVIQGYGIGPAFFSQAEAMAASNTSDLKFLITEDIIPIAINLLPFFNHLIIKCGPRGVVIVSHMASNLEPQNIANPHLLVHSFAHGKGNICISAYPVINHISPEMIINTTGAGDTFVGVLAAGIARNPGIMHDFRMLEKLVYTAQKASALTLQTANSISPELTYLEIL